ncbi:Uma2 family endonuclease [Anatilimnocola sp. NA78]|uniref:Uma2 family endonuclease n=1 Tax=Anatilimnocola sp. NA78 TaxID=3415683 RepID=UPI003CE56719
MSAAPTRRITPSEYLELDRVASERFQYYRGEMFAMAGGTKNHNRIARNMLVAFENHFRKHLRRCETFSSDLRLQVNPQSFYTYPDVTVVCGEAKFLDERADTLTNATLIVEVLSPSTEHFDRGKKFENYRQLESLQEYVLVSQHKPLVERFLRENDGSWKLNVADHAADKLHLASLDLQLPLSEIYLDVDFPPIVEDPPGELKAPPFDETNRPY